MVVFGESHVTPHVLQSLADTESFSIYFYLHIYIHIYECVNVLTPTYTCIHTWIDVYTQFMAKSAMGKFHWIQWKLHQITKHKDREPALWCSDSQSSQNIINVNISKVLQCFFFKEKAHDLITRTVLFLSQWILLSNPGKKHSCDANLLEKSRHCSANAKFLLGQLVSDFIWMWSVLLTLGAKLQRFPTKAIPHHSQLGGGTHPREPASAKPPCYS